MSRLVIHPKKLPSRLPIVGNIAWILLLDRLHVWGWVWGAAAVIIVVFDIGAVAGVILDTWSPVSDVIAEEAK